MFFERVRYGILKVLMICVIFMPLIGCGVKGNDMNSLKKKPIFYAHVQSFGVSYGVTVNGVYIQKQFDPEVQDDLTLPINHWLRSGENTVSLQVVPDEQGEAFEPGARVSVTFLVKSSESTESEGEVLAKTIFNGGQDDLFLGSTQAQMRIDSDRYGVLDVEDVKIGELSTERMKDFDGGLIARRTITMKVPFPLWKFFGSDNLPDVQSLDEDEYSAAVDELMFEYKKIEEAIVSNNIDSIMPLFAERNTELDQSFNQAPGTTEKELRESLEESANDASLAVSRMQREMLSFWLTENDKLLELERVDGGPAISLDYDSGGSIGFPLIFRRENGQWIITR